VVKKSGTVLLRRLVLKTTSLLNGLENIREVWELNTSCQVDKFLSKPIKPCYDN